MHPGTHTGRNAYKENLKQNKEAEIPWRGGTEGSDSSSAATEEQDLVSSKDLGTVPRTPTLLNPNPVTCASNPQFPIFSSFSFCHTENVI